MKCCYFIMSSTLSVGNAMYFKAEYCTGTATVLFFLLMLKERYNLLVLIEHGHTVCETWGAVLYEKWVLYKITVETNLTTVPL